MIITIDVPFDDPLLDISKCSLNKTIELVDYGDRKVPLEMYDPDYDIKYGDYEVIDADYDALEKHLSKLEEEEADNE